MSEPTRPTLQAAAVAVAPVALTASLVAHPYLAGQLPNDTAVAAAVAADTTRWGLVHLATAVSSALIILAFLAIRAHLREVGDRHSAVGVPFIVVGSALFGLLPGMEFAPLAVAESGGDVAAIAGAQQALEPWFLPVLVSGSATFAIGVVAFARGIVASHVLSRPLMVVVATALFVMAVARFVPFAAVQFYVQSIAALLALLPLAYHLSRPTRAAVRVRREPATTG